MMKERPLQGKRIVITRAEEQSDGLLARLRALGAEPFACPAIAIVPPADFAPLDAAIARLPAYDWLIVTSVNGAHALVERIGALGQDLAPLRRLKIGAIGPATAEALQQHGLKAGFMPTSFVAEAILDQIGDVAGQRILLPRADIAREALVVGLRERGAVVDEIAAYRTVPGAGAPQLAQLLRAHAVDAITFSSSSTVRYMLDGLGAAGLGRPEARALLGQAAVVCIGPITAATAQEEGLRVDAVAREYTAEGLVETLVEWFAPPVQGSGVGG
jgi:uroporphyrinogen-III synthase